MDNCVNCGHPAEWHGDHVVIPCAIERGEKFHTGKCYCIGYENRPAMAYVFEPSPEVPPDADD